MGLDSIIHIKFKRAFEEKCFQLLNEAYQTSLDEKIIQKDWPENDISQELIEKVDENPLRLKWNITASREFHIEKDRKKHKGYADKLPRIDFKLSNIFAEKEYKYYFEAKRLKENDSDLKRAYINEGMDRFISKKYPPGCMLGYLLEGKIDKTINGINKLLIRDSRNSELLISANYALSGAYFESSHFEIGILKHLLLDYTVLNPRP